MNRDLQRVDGSQPTEDEQAIADYFASETYARRTSRSKVARVAADRPVWPNPVLSPRTSFWMGVLGLSVMLLVFGNMAPILAGSVRSLVDANFRFAAFLLLDQTAMFPAFVCFTYAIVTPMFWYGSVLVRFALALLLIVPGCLTFLAAAAWLDPPTEFLSRYTTIVIALFVVIGVVTVLVQMWSRWTLSHSRPIGAPVAAAQTRSIMELTGVAAVGCAALVTVNTKDLAEALFFFITLGLFATGAVISMLIGFLRPEGRNSFAVAVSVLFAAGLAFIYSAMHAFQQFGWDELPDMLPLTLSVSIYGTVLLMAVMWLCIAWLRSSGWACLHRREEKRLREADRKDLWEYWFR